MASDTPRYSPDSPSRDQYRRNSSWDRHNRTPLQSRPYDSRDRSESPNDADHNYWRRRRRSTTRSRTRSRDGRSLLSDDRSSYDGYRSGSSRRRSSTPLRKPKTIVFRPVGPPLKSHLRGVSAVKFSPDGTMFASCSADATFKLWSTPTSTSPTPTPTLLHTFSGHLAGLSALTWSPDSRTLATASDDKCIRLWDIPRRSPYPTPLVGHHNYVDSLAFSPKGNMLVSGSHDEAVFLWDARSGRVLRTLPAHSDPVGGVDFSRDGSMVVSCASDGLIRVWDTQTGQCLKTLVHEDRRPVTSVQFVPNSRFVLAWTLDSCVRLWDYGEGKCVKTYFDRGYVNQNFGLKGAVGKYIDGAPRESFVVSGSEDGGMVVWDVGTKEVVWRKEKAHRRAVLGVDVFREGGGRGRALMVSGSLDRTVRLWREVWEGDEDDDAAENGIVGDEQEASKQVNGHADVDVDAMEIEQDAIKEEPGQDDEIMETVEEFRE